MNIKKILNLQSAQEKIGKYKVLLKKSLDINNKVEEMSKEFLDQSEILKSISLLGTDERKEVQDRHNSFLLEHAKKIAKLQKEKSQIEKSINKLESDEEIYDAIIDLKILHDAKCSYKNKRISKSVYNDIIKAKTGKVRYADVLLFRGDKLLILQRAGEMGSNTQEWCIPGGHVDAGEDYREAACRELFEETGIEVPEDTLMEVAIAESKDCIIHYFMGHVDDDAPTTVLVDSEEEIGSEWIYPSIELDNYEFIFDMKDNLKKILGLEIQPSPLMKIQKAFNDGIISQNVFKAYCDKHPEEIEKANNKTYFSHKERKDLAKKGEAMPNGKYPIRNAQDLHDAIRLVGASSMPEDEVKAWIKKRAKALGLTDELPESWGEKKENVEKTMDCDDTNAIYKEHLDDEEKKPDGDGIEKAVRGFSLKINFNDLDQADMFKSLINEMKNSGKLDIESVETTEKSKDAMYKVFADFANFLEGAKTRTKNIHWGELDNSKHVYLDDLEDTLSDYEDKVMEAGQSKFGRFEEGEINGEEIDVNNPIEFIDLIIERSQIFHEAIKDNIDYLGEMSWIEDFIGELMQTKYRLQMH